MKGQLGEPNAGMIEAGFRKKRERKKLSPLERIRKLLPKLTPSERDQLRAELDELVLRSVT